MIFLHGFNFVKTFLQQSYFCWRVIDSNFEWVSYGQWYNILYISLCNFCFFNNMKETSQLHAIWIDRGLVPGEINILKGSIRWQIFPDTFLKMFLASPRTFLPLRHLVSSYFPQEKRKKVQKCMKKLRCKLAPRGRR